MSESITPNELVLTESRTARQQYGNRIDILDKVRAIPLLPDNLHITSEGIAAFFDVPIDTVRSLVREHREELDASGYTVLRGEALAEFAKSIGHLANPVGSKTRSLALFDRRTLLNVAMLLRDSEVARQVRRYLLDSEQAIRDLEAEALSRRSLGEPLTWTWYETCTVIKQRYGIDFNENTLRRRLRTKGVLRQTWEPKKAHRALFWFTGTAWEIHAHAVPELLRLAVEVDQQLRAFQGIQARLELEFTTDRGLPGGGAR